jgi:hypothetical protein
MIHLIGPKQNEGVPTWVLWAGCVISAGLGWLVEMWVGW